MTIKMKGGQWNILGDSHITEVTCVKYLQNMSMD